MSGALAPPLHAPLDDRRHAVAAGLLGMATIHWEAGSPAVKMRGVDRTALRPVADLRCTLTSVLIAMAAVVRPLGMY